MRKFFLGTVISATLYAASFLKATLLWPFSFVFLLPLMRCNFSSYRSAALYGYLWGIVAFSGVFSALLDLIILLGTGPLRYVYAVIFMSYCAFFSAVWFVSARFFALVTKSLAVGWGMSSVCYFAWLYTGYFYGLTGAGHGCPLVYPLIPAIDSGLLGFLPVVGWFGLLCTLVCLQVGIVYKKIPLVLMAGTVFLGGCLHNQDYSLPEWEKNLIPVAAFFKETTPYERAQEICTFLLDAQLAHPQAHLFVLPESSFPFPLEKHEYAIAMWSSNGALFEKYLVIPAHHQVEDCHKFYNSVYVLHKGRIIFRYDKKHLLPFFEEASRNPFLKNCHKLFFTSKAELVAAPAGAQQWSFSKTQMVNFCICSELLWNFTSPAPSGITCVMVHDGYYRYPYFQKIFTLFAKFKALEKRCTIAYAAWSTALIL